MKQKRIRWNRNICTVDGCERHTVGYGYCSSHWKKWRLYGDPLKSGRVGKAPNTLQSVRENFNSFWEDVNGCWEWNRGLDIGGYGRIKIEGKTMKAHRLSHIFFKSDIPPELFVCHKCDNRKCVNPDHLFLGTAQDNVIDCVSKNRHRHAIPKSERREITDVDVLIIYADAARGIPHYRIAREMGIAPVTVRRIVTGQSRKKIHNAILRELERRESK